MAEPQKPANEPAAGGGVAWEGFHEQDASWRKKLIGEISDAFVLPRYVRLFYDTFSENRDRHRIADAHGEKPRTAEAQSAPANETSGACPYFPGDFIEIGAGNGENSKAILAANKGQIRKYLTTEVFKEGVEWLQKQGLEAQQASAEALPFEDQSFTAVISFDVLHHVDHPRVMAREMMRVGRGRALLTESNGLSLPRKLLELTPARRAAGERSYTPWRYRSFFEDQPGFKVTRFLIYPFLFPFKCPHAVLPLLVWFNRIIEYVPFCRWQCSSVVIVVDYERVASA